MRKVVKFGAFFNRAGIFRRALVDTSGAVMLEFAFVVVPLVTLIVAVLQVALIFFASQLLDTATQASARTIMTGNTQTAAMSQADFKAAACARLPTFMECSKLTVDVVKSSSFASASTGAPTVTYNGSGDAVFPNRYIPGGPNDIVMVRFMYPWGVIGAPNGLNLATLSNGKFLMMATTVMRTEPY